MFIPKIILTNFRSHVDTTFEFSRVNVIRGENGSGKTTLLHAIEWCLTGKASSITTESGQKSERLVTHGAKEMSVCIHLYDPEIGATEACSITRNKTRAGNGLVLQAPDFTTPDKVGDDAEKWIKEFIGDKSLITALLNANSFLLMGEKEQKALLVSALAGNSVVVPANIQEAMKACGGMVLGSIADDAQAEKVYKEYYKLRSAFNKTVSDFGDIVKPEVPENLPDSKSVATKLSNLRSEKDALVLARQRTISESKNAGIIERQNALNAIDNERKAIVAKWTADAERLRSALTSIKTHKSALLEGEELARLQTIIGKTQTAKELDDKIVNLTRELADVDRAILQMQSKGSKTCPTCGQPIKAEDLTAQLAEKQEVKKGIELQIAQHRGKREAIGDPVAAAAKVEAHKKAVTGMKPAEDTANELRNLPAEANTAAIDRKYIELKNSPIPESAAPDTSEVDGKIAELEKRITHGEEVQTKVTLLEGKISQYQETADKLTAAQSKAAKADTVVKALEPGGLIRSSLIGDRFEGFKQRLIEGLAYFDFTCKIELNPYTFLVKEGEAYQEICQLCESEKFRFGIAFQISLAEATGIKFVCIDRSDVMVDPDMRKSLAKMLMESSLHQAVVLLASKNPDTPESLPEGVSIIDIAKENGRSKVTAVHRG